MADEQAVIPQQAVFSLRPRNIDEALKYSEMIAKSDLVPNDYKGKAANVLIAIQWGYEVGLKPLQALQNIAVINGRPSMYGDSVLALVRSSGLLEDFREDLNEQTGTATCTAKRKGQPTPIVRTFSRADAEVAGLWGKNNWKFYAKRMLQMRARAFALRDGFADVLKGIAVAEEQQDVAAAEPAASLPAPPAEIAAPAAAPTEDAQDWRPLKTARDGICLTCGLEIKAGSDVLYSASRKRIQHAGTAECEAAAAASLADREPGAEG